MGNYGKLLMVSAFTLGLVFAWVLVNSLELTQATYPIFAKV